MSFTSWPNNMSNSTIGVGFGTAALRPNTYQIVTMALEAGFRKFDTAEEKDWWYDQANVGLAVKDFFSTNDHKKPSCQGLEMSTKIPPWSLTSVSDIRGSAARSRAELLGFCEDTIISAEDGVETTIPMPLDVYYIHAPSCWNGWHMRCNDPPSNLLGLQDAWMALEAVTGIDHSAKRIGLSNVQPNELLGIISFAEERIKAGNTDPPPRIPDVLQAYADPFHPAKELRAICKQYGIEFVSYSTLGTQHRNVNQNPVLTSPTVQTLAEKHSRSVAEVVLSWALQHNMSVIPRSTKQHHIEELARLLGSPTFLDEEDLLAIDTITEEDRSEEL